jgi:MFS family permease
MAMVVVACALVFVALPFFMVGGLAVQIKAEIGFSEAELGAAVTIGFVVAAISAPFGGRIADRIGPKRAIYMGCALCGSAMAGIGLVVTGWGTAVGFLCLAGMGVALTDPSLAILVSRSIRSDRQGLAFGVKEASIPASTLIAGLAVPTIALTAGWRWAFLIGLVPLAAVVILLPRLDTGSGVARPAPPPGNDRGSTPHRSALLLATVAGALGITAASGVGIFLTDSAVAMGMSPGNAGLLLAAGSVAGIAARIASGARADRTGGPQFRLIAGMLAVGAAAMLAGATGESLLLILGTLGTFGAGWAWTGVYFLSLVKTYPDRPGAVAGIATSGLGVGNAMGPVLFGLAAGSWSYGAAWASAAAVAALASVAMLIARRLF